MNEHTTITIAHPDMTVTYDVAGPVNITQVDKSLLLTPQDAEEWNMTINRNTTDD